MKKCLIFQIGFNKCGTSTIHKFFEKNNIQAIHHGSKKGSKVCANMFRQYKKNKPLFSEYVDQYVAFSDFGVYTSPNNATDILFLNNEYKESKNDQERTWLQVIHKQYEEFQKIYILNIRDVNHWLKSRYIHHDLVKRARKSVKKKFNEDIDDIEVLRRWRSLWYQYYCHAIQFFQQNGIENQMIVLDIEENDSLQKLSKFCNKFGLQTKGNFEIHENKSSKKRTRYYKNRRKMWNELVEMYPELSDNDDQNEFHRIMVKMQEIKELKMP